MKKICNLKPEDLNCNIFSCYDYDGLSLQELLCQFFTRLNECIDLSNETHDLAEWLTNEGLAQSVVRQLLAWKEDGTLADIINEGIFKELNDDIKHTAIAYPQGNKITDPSINDYSQVLTLGDNFESYPSGYGNPTFHVKNGIITLTGAVNVLSSLYDDGKATAYNMTNTWTALKQARPIPFNLVGYDSGYTRSSNFLATLDNSGRLKLDKTIYKNATSESRQDSCLALNASFPLLKNYPITDSYSEKIDAAVKDVLAVQNEGTSTIVLASDTHTNNQYNYEYTFGNYDIYYPTILNYANAHVGAFATILNGDVLNEAAGVNTTNMFEWLMKETRRQYCDNTLFVLGNHDDQSLCPEVANGSVKPISKNDYNRFLNKGKTGINFAGNNEPYYYTDDTTGKCRHIILNSHDVEGRKIHQYKFGLEQAKWLVKVLKSTPADYAIVLYCHISPKESKDMTKHGGNHMVNGDAIHQILADYNKKAVSGVRIDGQPVNYDFKDCKAMIAGCLSGHEHEDYHKTTDGINYIVEFSSKYNNEAYSYVVVDGKHRKIKVLRYNFSGSPRKNVELSY